MALELRIGAHSNNYSKGMEYDPTKTDYLNKCDFVVLDNFNRPWALAEKVGFLAKWFNWTPSAEFPTEHLQLINDRDDVNDGDDVQQMHLFLNRQWEIDEEGTTDGAEETDNADPNAELTRLHYLKCVHKETEKTFYVLTNTCQPKKYTDEIAKGIAKKIKKLFPSGSGEQFPILIVLRSPVLGSYLKKHQFTSLTSNVTTNTNKFHVYGYLVNSKKVGNPPITVKVKHPKKHVRDKTNKAVEEMVKAKEAPAPEPVANPFKSLRKKTLEQRKESLKKNVVPLPTQQTQTAKGNSSKKPVLINKSLFRRIYEQFVAFLKFLFCLNLCKKKA